ncbi:MAG: hypothetical protein GZ094_23425, partial [Mariniphaga sp.]|nr:hypothetical protein [Mariniphaga sp.]
TSGKYSVILKAKNEFGDSRKNFTIQVGTGLALTPPMGWNSWNVWALMSAPLLIGADLTKLNPFTFNLLSNREVIDIDQDILGKPAKRFKVDDLLEIWTKELSDGSVVVGLCNFGIQKHNIELNMKTIGLEGQYIIRDVWRQKDIGDLKGKFIANVKPHEVKLLKLIKKNN